MVWVCGRCGYEVPEDEISRYTLSEEELLKFANEIQDEGRKRLLAMGAWRCPGCGRVIRPMMIDEVLKVMLEERRRYRKW